MATRIRWEHRRGMSTRNRRLRVLEPLEPRLVLDSTIVLNEIMYHPGGDDESLEWVELHSQQGVDMDISGWRLAGGVDFEFPEGTVFPGDGYLVVAAAPEALQAATGFGAAVGPYRGRLANNGERLELRNNNDRVVDFVEYGDGGLWPVGPDGSGASLAKRDPDAASEPVESWAISAQVHGTPGAVNFPTGRERISIPGLAGTGIGADGGLATSGQSDLNWVVSDTQAPAIVMAPNPDWATSNDAQWIGLAATANENVRGGQITYSTSFDLTGINHTSAKLSINVVAADQLIDVVFNGTSLGMSSLGSTRLPRNPTEVTSGFLPGANTIEVITNNFGGPSGALVVLSGIGETLPLPPDPLDGLMFDEVAAAGDENGFVELANRGDAVIDLAGMRIRSSGGSSYTFDAGELQPGQRVAVTVDQLGFTPSNGESLFLVTASGDRVLDGARVRNSLKARSEDHDLRWLNASAATPGEANSFSIPQDVVINEIMYRGPTTPHISGMPPTFASTTYVAFDATWRHSKDFNFGAADLPLDPGPDWEEVAHAVDLISWHEGQAPLGFGRVASRAPRINKQLVNPQLVSNFITTYYFETDFGVSQQQIDEMDELQLQHMIDDGAVVYINGVEVQRFNMPAGDIGFDTLATTTVDRPDVSEPLLLPKDVLVPLPAMNRFSVEVHQSDVESDDIVFGVELVGRDLIDPGFPTKAPVESTEEWLELVNRSATETVDLTGWRVTDGVDYAFPAGTTIGPGQYLLLAGDPGSVLAKYPSLDPSTVLGPYAGTLSDRGERIELTDPNRNPADEVYYRERGRWPSAADGGGSSLELRDPDADNSAPEAWAASDETARSSWNTYTYRATGENPISNDPRQYSEFLFGLNEEGELLIDDIRVIQNPGTADAQPLIQNGSFDSDTVGDEPAAWRIIGNHHGMVVADPDDATNQALYVRTEGPTEHLHNNAGTTLKAGDELVSRIDDDAEYEISFRAKWLSGSNQLNTRLYFNRAARTTLLVTPDVHGTPGMPNSTFVENAGPTYEDLQHGPVVPADGQDVTVSVVAADPEGIASMTLWYSVDDGPFESVEMTAGDNGLYAGIVPGQAASSVVQFYVEGRDNLGATSMFPAEGPESRAMFAVQDGRANFDTGAHNIRIIMTPADTTWLHTSTNVMSNDPMKATIVYDEQEVFYGTTLRLKGSQRGRDKPVRVGFLVKFDPMQPFRGVHETMAIDRSGSGDEFSQEEILVKQGIHHAGDVPATYDDLIHVVAPRNSETGSALLMTGFRDYFLETAFEDGGNGTMFEYELIYYPTTTVGGDPEGLKIPNPDTVVGAAMADHGANKEAYRWHWLIKNNRDADDYQQMIDALQVLGLRQGEEFHRETQRLLDVDNWLRSFAVQNVFGIGDNYATNSGPWHNAFFYARPDGKTMYFPYDMDFTFTQGATTALVLNTELRKLVDDPGNEHMYLGHVHDIVTTTFNSEYMDPWIDHYQSKLTSRQPWSAFKSYIRQRHDDILNRQLPDEVPYAITTQGPLDVGDATTATVAGDGWINVRNIRLAGRQEPLDVTWTDVTTWEAAVPVNNATRTLTLEAYDFQDQLIGTTEIDVSSTAVNPVADSLRITEINYNPYGPTSDELAVNPALNNDDFEFIELQNVGGETIDLRDVRFTNGIEFAFPAVSLDPGSRTVVVKNMEAFRLRYGDEVPVAGPFRGGSLNNRGERLALVDALETTILDFQYGDNDPWPERADGLGATLQLIAPASTAPDQLDRYDVWRGSTDFGGSPGADGAAAAGIVINEVLTNTDDPEGPTDTIELFNTTGDVVDIGGWYLSDSAGSLFKYQIPAGTKIAPLGYAVFDEGAFNPTPAGPGNFALSGTRGDDVWLVISDGSEGVAAFVDDVHFGAAPAGESFGRTPNGTGRLAPMATPTLGEENAAPRVGPVVISEINYNPAEPSPAALAIDPELGRDDLEFIEIVNGTDSLLDLSSWELSGGADYQFPAGVQIAPGQTVVVVSFNPADGANANRTRAFREQYQIDAGVLLVGGYQGQLDDDGEMVQLLRPDTPTADVPPLTPMLLEDEVIYDDHAPWPVAADGTGDALSRMAVDALGNAAASWTSQPPSVGSTDFTFRLPGDSNQDGKFDQTDLTMALSAGKYLTGQPATFAEGDWNGDGVFNELDVVTALQTGRYSATPAAALAGPAAESASEPTANAIDDWFAQLGRGGTA